MGERQKTVDRSLRERVRHTECAAYDSWVTFFLPLAFPSTRLDAEGANYEDVRSDVRISCTRRSRFAMAKVTYRVEGLDCTEEVATLRAELLPLVGVRDVACNVLEHTVTIEYDDRLPKLQVLTAAVRRAGMEARPLAAATSVEEETALGPNRRLMTTIVSGVMLVLGLLLQLFATSQSLQDGLGPLPNAIRLCYLLADCGRWLVRVSQSTGSRVASASGHEPADVGSGWRGAAAR